MLYAVATLAFPVLLVEGIFVLTGQLALGPAAEDTGRRIVTGVLSTVVWTVLLHLSCRLWGVHRLGFTATFRVFAYAFTPTVFAPALLWFEAGQVLSLALLAASLGRGVQGLVYACGSTWGRALGALLVSPMWLLVCLFVALYNFFSRT